MLIRGCQVNSWQLRIGLIFNVLGSMTSVVIKGSGYASAKHMCLFGEETLRTFPLVERRTLFSSKKFRRVMPVI